MHLLRPLKNLYVESELDTGIDAKEPKIFNIDISKCRKNIFYYGIDKYCVFTVFDKVKKYKIILLLFFILGTEYIES